MALLDDVVSASGGLEQWRRFRRFTFHVSIQGSLLAHSSAATHLKDAVVEGCTQTQWVRLTSFSGTDKCAVYRPGQVSIESLDGTLLEVRNDPHAVLLSHGGPLSWDELDVAYICGLSIWNFVATPFLLTQSGVQVEELPPWHERDESWGRLRAVFPDDIATLSREQIFYFDAAGLQRRTDHQMPGAAGAKIVHYSWAHQAFSDILIPTLRQSSLLQPDGSVVTKPAFIDLEIFDASFE
jgi:hypothetical protein